MNHISRAGQKYLRKHGEPEMIQVSSLFETISSRFYPCEYTHCIVIPCFNEEDDFIRQYADLVQNINFELNLLLIVIINQPDTVIEPNHNNQQQWEKIKKSHAVNQLSQQNILIKQYSRCFSILAIDRFSCHKIPAHQGVGLARKIGVDIAYMLYLQGYLKTSWIGNTDADAKLNLDYLSKINQIPISFSAQTFSFTHQDSEKNAQYPSNLIFYYTKIYEKKICAYVQGLKSANSPYAHYSVGSCIAINLEQYVKIHGFPKKAAGEDFYLLNKLRKLGQIYHHDDIYITLKSRISNRVPFGTGQNVQLLIENNDTYIFYHPGCFILLRIFLETILFILSHTNLHHDDHILDDIQKISLLFNENIKSFRFKSNDIISRFDINKLYHLNIDLFLEQLDLYSFIFHLKKQNIDPSKYHQHWFIWFDGLKTLKTVNYFKKHIFKDISYCEWQQLYKNT